jgi:hypothetical protein
LTVIFAPRSKRDTPPKALTRRFVARDHQNQKPKTKANLGFSRRFPLGSAAGIWQLSGA